MQSSSIADWCFDVSERESVMLPIRAFTKLFRLGIIALVMTLPACSSPTVTPTLVSTPAPTLPAPGVGRIMFLSRHKDTNQIYFRQDILLIRSDGSEMMDITKSGFNESPAWSPDGQFIAFANDKVYIANVNNGKLAGVTDLKSSLPIRSLTWSLDGKQIAFATNDNSGGGALYATTIKNTENGLTGSSAKLLRNNMDASDLAWSMDGMYLAFAHRSELHESTEVGILEIATGEFTNILTSTNSPTWSPDGKQIALVAKMTEDNNSSEIVLFNIADLIREKGVVVPVKLTQNTSSDGSPSWSPDGKSIVFVSDRDGNAEIYVMNADGSHQMRLTDNPEWDAYPVWSPDSKQIAFVSNRDGNAEIYVMNADGSHLLRLTNNTVDDLFPVWQPQLKP